MHQKATQYREESAEGQEQNTPRDPRQDGFQPILQQLAAQQAMLQQLAANQQALWQQLQDGQAAAAQQPENHGQSCDNPNAQTEHFMHMADKFCRGELGMTDVANSLNILNNQSSNFWKGLLIGGGITLLLSNESIRASIADLFSRTGGGQEAA